MSQKEHDYHIPALFRETLEGLAIHPSGVYVDATYGGGGHARGILAQLGDKGRLYGFDQDQDAIPDRVADERFTFVYSNFRYLSNFMRYYGERQVDGILADLGVSSHHLDDATRGFSFRFDGRLDMRMNRRAGKTAADVLNTYAPERLADIFYRYGELKAARKMAAAIVRKRESAPVLTVSDLLDALSPFFGREKEKKAMAQAFQALRIEVNGEMEALHALLTQSLALLKEGGRLVVITYHSLEDRPVKNFIKTGNFDGHMEQNVYGNIPSPFRSVSRVITPSAEELQQNPRARSAKLRIAEKKWEVGSQESEGRC
jgi:16S rRNA (cytosine1402-N4)-methyltransferase